MGGLRKPGTNMNNRMSYDHGKGLHDIAEEEKQTSGGGQPMSIK